MSPSVLKSHKAQSHPHCLAALRMARAFHYIAQFLPICQQKSVEIT